MVCNKKILRLKLGKSLTKTVLFDSIIVPEASRLGCDCESLEDVVDDDSCKMSSNISIYSIALLKISTFGSLCSGLVQVLRFNFSNASFTLKTVSKLS